MSTVAAMTQLISVLLKERITVHSNITLSDYTDSRPTGTSLPAQATHSHSSLLGLLNSRKSREEDLGFLSTADVVFILDSEVRDPMDIVSISFLNFLINLCTSLARLQPLLHLGRSQPSLLSSSYEGDVRGNVALALEVRPEEFRHDFVLDLGALRFAQLDQTVRVPRVSRAPREGEVDPFPLSCYGQPLLDHLYPVGAELLDHPFHDRHPHRGSRRVQVEREPADGEGVVLAGRVCCAVQLDGAVEPLLADVALGMTDLDDAVFGVKIQ